ncbi:MAG TPA: sugar porter family MFS transporter [Thermoleophilaceae bacterium]|jgi:sugar porter (SP) family MFS transporter
MDALQLNGRRIFVFGALGGLLFGYDTGVISGAILFITDDFGLSPFMQGAVVAALLLGAMVGAALAGPLSDRVGRRRLIMAAAITFTIGALGAAAAPSAGVLVAFRAVIGLAVGSAALVVPLYLSEIAPTQIRGAVASMNQLMIVSGILVAFIVNAILASSADWRLMLGLAAVPSLVLLVGMFFMPETPRHLVRAGEEEEAREVLEEVRPDDAGREEHPDHKIEEIREADEREDDEESALSLLRERWVRPALVVAIGLAIFQQFIGINTIIYYAPTTLTSVGFGNEGAIYANLVIGVLNVAMTILAIRLVDRVGRKPMLLVGLVGMVLSLTVLGVSSEVLDKPTSASDPEAIITLVCLAGFIVSFAATWGPVVWVMLPEVLPLSVRGTAMGVAVCLHWGANFLVSQSFPIMLDSWGAGPVFLGYAAIGVLAFLFVKALVPETKGRSLEEIEAALQREGGRRERQPAGVGAAR